MIGGKKCKTERVGITMTEEKWNQSLSDKKSTYFKNLESQILMAVSISRLSSQCLSLLLQRPVHAVCVPTKNPLNFAVYQTSSLDLASKSFYAKRTLSKILTVFLVVVDGR